jgi:PAS domain-containing protein
LVRYFSLTTLATVVVGAALVAAIVTRLTRDELVRRTETHAVAVAHHLIYELYHRFLLPQVTAGGQADIETMASWEDINRLAAPLKHFQDLHEVKIFGPTGTVFYSSHPDQAALRDPTDPGFRAAMQGHIVSNAPGAKWPAHQPGGGGDQRITTTYVPIFEIAPGLQELPDNGRVIGVMEVYQDVSAMLSEYRRQRQVILALVAAAMASLYLVLLGIIYRADRRMAADCREIQEHHGTILEQRYRLDTILAHLKEGVALYDEARRIVFMNRPMIERFGDQRGSVCHEALYGLSHPCCLTQDERKDEHLCRQTWFSMRTPKDDYFEIFTTPIPRPDGATWTLELVRDIGDRVAMQRQRIRMRQALADERRRTVNEMVVGLNHQMNNSLAGIITTLHLLEDANLGDSERREARDRVKREVEQLQRILTSLPQIGEMHTTEYLAGVSMVDPWVIQRNGCEPTRLDQPAT